MRLTHWLSMLGGDRNRRRGAASAQMRRRGVAQQHASGNAGIESLEARTLLTAPTPVDLGTLDLNDPQDVDGFRVNGVTRNDKTGDSVSGAGDVNGDGLEDFIVGTPTVGQAGGAYIVYGKSTGVTSSMDLSALDATTGVRLNGDLPMEQAGSAVSGIGDLNGDGFDDVAVASHASQGGAGTVWVVFGGPSLPAEIDLATLDGDDGFRLNGNNGDNAGRSVNPAGDVNGDGLDDLIIGAPAPANYALGSAYVVFGKTGSFASTTALSSLDGSNGFKATTSISGYGGESASGAGDFNGDGIDDVIIGEAYYDGRSYVLFGKTSAFSAVEVLDNLASPNGFRIEGQYIGRSVGAAGDINGDGFDDLITTAAYSNYINDDVNERYGYTGQAFVIFGRAPDPENPLNVLDVSTLDGTNGFRVQGTTPGDHLGDAVGGAGDINGDGLDDLVLGVGRAEYSDQQSQFGTGQTYVIYGRRDGFAPTLNVRVPNDPDPDPGAYLDGVNGFRLDGQVSGDYAGRSVSILGDVDGDGLDDLLVGAPDVGPNDENIGAAYVVLGRAHNAGNETQIGTDPGADNIDTLNADEGVAAIDRLIGGLGDDNLNADGGADVLVGGQGNDTLGIATGNVAAAFRFDGGTGIDTLKLGGAAAFAGDLDLTAIPDSRITDIERVDLRGSGTNALTLNLSEVLNISGTSNELRVRRDVTDTVAVGTGWTNAARETHDGVIYQVLTQGEARLLIESFVTVTVSPATVGEGSGSGLIYTFTRTDSTGNVTVNFSVSGSATFGADYTAAGASSFSGGTGTVVINDKSASASVTLLPVNDTVVEGDEDATLTLTSAAGYNIGTPSTATGTIDDNDIAVVSFDSSASTADEDVGTHNVAVRLTVTANGTPDTGTIAEEIRVNVDELGSGSAGGSDFSFTDPTTLTFVAGSSSGTRNAAVGVTDDTVLETDETIDFRLNALTNTIDGQVSIDSGNDDHTATIDDNESAVLAFSAANSNPSEAAGTQDVTVELTITANGVQNTGTLSSAVSVDVARTGGTATAGTDDTFSSPTTLTFGAGASSGSMNATVSLTDDTVVESNETITFALNGLSTALNDVSIDTNADDHTLTIDENDTAVFAFASATSNPSETVGTQNVGVTLTITGNGQVGTGTLSTPLTVNVVDLQSGTAGDPADYSFTSPTQLTFSSASETKTAAVTIVDDAVSEPAETIDLQLNGLSNDLDANASIAPSGDSHTVTIAESNSVDPATLQTELRIVQVATSTDSDDEAAALPTNASFLDEWDEFFVEVWGRVSNSGVGVETADIEIPFSEDRFIIDSVELGASFGGNSSSSIDTTEGAGLVTLNLETTRTDAGLNGFVLFARLSVRVDMAIPNNFLDQYIEPVIDTRFEANNMSSTMDGGDDLMTVDMPNLQTEIWPVMYDVDDDNVVGFGDIPAFSAAFGTSTGSNNGAFEVDFDHDGSVSFSDVTLLASNIGRGRSSTGEQTYVASFPNAWRPTLLAESTTSTSQPLSQDEILTGNTASLVALITAAIEQFQNAGLASADAETLTNVEVAVRDLPGSQLGVAEDNVIVIDATAAGAGWFIDATPESASEFATGSAVNGRYDLLTVIAHELGHILGLDHGHAGGLMDDTLPTGGRRTVTAADIDELYAAFDDLGDALQETA